MVFMKQVYLFLIVAIAALYDVQALPFEQPVKLFGTIANTSKNAVGKLTSLPSSAGDGGLLGGLIPTDGVLSKLGQIPSSLGLGSLSSSLGGVTGGAADPSKLAELTGGAPDALNTAQSTIGHLTESTLGSATDLGSNAPFKLF